MQKPIARWTRRILGVRNVFIVELGNNIPKRRRKLPNRDSQSRQSPLAAVARKLDGSEFSVPSRYDATNRASHASRGGRDTGMARRHSLAAKCLPAAKAFGRTRSDVLANQSAVVEPIAAAGLNLGDDAGDNNRGCCGQGARNRFRNPLPQIELATASAKAIQRTWQQWRGIMKIKSSTPMPATIASVVRESARRRSASGAAKAANTETETAAPKPDSESGGLDRARVHALCWGCAQLHSANVDGRRARGAIVQGNVIYISGVKRRRIIFTQMTNQKMATVMGQRNQARNSARPRLRSATQ